MRLSDNDSIILERIKLLINKNNQVNTKDVIDCVDYIESLIPETLREYYGNTKYERSLKYLLDNADRIDDIIRSITYNKAAKFTKEKIPRELLLKMLDELNDELKKRNVIVDMEIYGGIVMSLVYNARESTRDVDAIFNNTKIVLEITREIGNKYDVDSEWLNDHIKDIKEDLKRERMHKLSIFSNIRITHPVPEQMLAMKLLAARGFPHEDKEDSKLLTIDLKLKSDKDILKVFKKYFADNLLEEKTLKFISIICDELSLKKLLDYDKLLIKRGR